MSNLRNSITGMWRKVAPSLLILITLIGLAGSILFSPLYLDEGRTCLFDCMAMEDEVAPISFAQVVPGAQPINDFSQHTFNDMMNLKNHIRLQNYMDTYLLWWWGSVGIFIIGATRLYKKRKLPKQVFPVYHDPKMGNYS